MFPRAFSSMLIEIFYLIASALLGLVLVVRLTDRPIRLGFRLVETGANTFTTGTLNVPSTPSVAVSRGQTKLIGIEVMKVVSEMPPPNVEAGQSNSVKMGISKGPAPTVGVNIDDQRTIWSRVRRVVGVTVTSVGEIFIADEDIRYDDLTDGDGAGEIVSDNEIHMTIQGSGNASAITGNGYLLYHLVELDANEAVFEMIEQSQ